MSKVVLVRANFGGVSEIEKPKDYKAIQEIVGGTFGVIPLPGGRDMYVHDEGKLIGLPKNEAATYIFRSLYPIEEYPLNNDELVVGDVLFYGRNLKEIVNMGRRIECLPEYIETLFRPLRGKKRKKTKDGQLDLQAFNQDADVVKAKQELKRLDIDEDWLNKHGFLVAAMLFRF